MTISNKIISAYLKENKGRFTKFFIEWLKDYEPSERYSALKDLLRHGCKSGMVTHLIYYEDTVKYYDKYEDEIWELVFELKETFGFKNVFKFLSTLNDSNFIGSIQEVKNLLVWFAFEEEGFRFERFLEEYEGNKDG